VSCRRPPGRNVAPYVEMEWGSKAYELMWELKGLFDPSHTLNPGVILNRDPDAHLKVRPQTIRAPRREWHEGRIRKWRACIGDSTLCVERCLLVALTAFLPARPQFLKPSPAASPIVNRCIECGFCESNCPSKDITLTPRQRITVFREMHRLTELGPGASPAEKKQLEVGQRETVLLWRRCVGP
jgi:D-lactate dehydrogenase